MFNKTNLVGWINLAFRLLLSLGLVAVVERCYGADYTKSWLIYITLIASIQAADGLLSQFFVRELLYATATGNRAQLKRCQKHQLRFYWGISLVFLASTWVTLPDDTHHFVAILIAIFCIAKVYDSRARSYLPVNAFQKIELAINAAIIIVMAVVFYVSDNYYWVPVFHLAGLIVGLLIKSYWGCSGGKRIGGIPTAVSTQSSSVRGGLWQSTVIALGGSLSVNLALLMLQGLLGDKLSASFLLTYRISALVCEISSLPLIIRIPEITRLLVEHHKEQAAALFKANYRQSLILCCAGFFLVNAFAGLWNNWLPKGLQIEVGVVLATISLAWVFERSATLMSQLYLSLKDYTVVWVYMVYILLIMLSTLMAGIMGKAMWFSGGLMGANFLVSLIVIQHGRVIRVK